MLPQGEFTNPPSSRLQAVFPEKGPNSNRTQLNADDFMPLIGKPDHVQTLAAEGDKYSNSSGQIKTGPESGKKLIHRFLVEIGSLVAPALYQRTLSRLVMIALTQVIAKRSWRPPNFLFG